MSFANELRECEERFRALAEHSSEGIVVAVDDRFVYVNPATIKLLGAEEADQLLGRSLYDFVSDEMKDIVKARRRDVLQRGIPAPPIEGFLFRLDGSRVFGEAIAVPFVFGGKPAILNLLRDATERKRTEDALRQAEQSRTDVVNNIDGIVWEADPRTFQFTFVSHQAERLLGYPIAQWLTEPGFWASHIHPEDRDWAVEYCIQCTHQKQGHDFEYRMVAADGRTVWLRDIVSVVVENDQPTMLRGLMVDVTARKVASDALRDSEERFRQVVENIQEVFWMTDVEKNKMLYISPGYEQIWGRTCESLGQSPRAWLEAIHPEDRARVIQAAVTKQALCEYDEQYRIVRPDGAVRWIHDRAYPIRDETGKVYRIVGVAEDITKLKEFEQARWRSEEHFRSLIENAQDLITNIGADGMIRFQSPSCLSALGYTPEEIVGRSAFQFIHPDDAPSVKAALERAIRNPQRAASAEFRFRHANGSWRTLESLGKRLMSEETPTVVVNSRDITERRRLEDQIRQSQKLEAVGQLAGGVAHDFNNILAAMMMQADLAAACEGVPPEVQELLNDIRACAERAANLTRQLLAFSRRQVMQPRQLDLNEIVTSLAKMLQRILSEDVRMHLDLHPGPLITYADAGMLDQVLMNLAVNARDAMPQGGRLVIETAERVFTEEDVRFLPEASPGRYVCLRVNDSGCGIPPENLSRIFEPFFTTKESGQGTGLGLATVFGIVKQHGGALKVYSELGRGTTFQVFLPASAVVNESVTKETARALPRGGMETILVAEDDPMVRMMTRIVLERHGYQVLEAANGIEALRVWEKHGGGVHLLLTDLVMPEGMNGLELAAQLQGRNPNLKVIFTSGYSAEVAGREAMLQEGQNFLQKPTPLHQLLETVRRCLDR